MRGGGRHRKAQEVAAPWRGDAWNGMRILRINSWDGPGRGGAEEYIRTVADALEQLGHPNRIVNITDVVEPRPRQDENYLGIVPMSRRARRLPQDLREGEREPLRGIQLPPRVSPRTGKRGIIHMCTMCEPARNVRKGNTEKSLSPGRTVPGPS